MSSIQTMRGLKTSEYPLAQPYRIKVIKATDKTKLDDYAKDMPVDKYKKEELQLLNALYPNEKPQAGAAAQDRRVIARTVRQHACGRCLDFSAGPCNPRARSRAMTCAARLLRIPSRMTDKKLELIDPASGKKALLPVRSGTIGPSVVDIAPLTKDFGVFTYDPGYGSPPRSRAASPTSTAMPACCCTAAIPIEQLAEKSTFMEVCVPAAARRPAEQEAARRVHRSIRHHTMINETLLRFFNGFHHNAHPMAMVSAVVASMSAFYHDTMDIHNPRQREIFAHRIVAKIPTIAAAAHKHSLGQPFIYPRNDLDYCSNMLHMFFAVPCEPYKLDPVAAQALDLLFVLHADHEQNASTSTVRLAGSTGANPYAAISAGVSALWGPAHGGANEAVLAMLEQIGTVENIPKYLAMAKDKSSHFRLMGFGHRVYKNFDPRAKIIRAMCHKVLAKLGKLGQSAVRAGAAAGRDRAEGRVLRRAQALPERRFLFGHHLQRDRHSALDVHGDVRDRAHRRLGGALAGDDLGSGDAHRPSAPALHRPDAAQLPVDIGKR